MNESLKTRRIFVLVVARLALCSLRFDGLSDIFMHQSIVTTAPAPGNSGDFDFLSSKTQPPKNPTLWGQSVGRNHRRVPLQFMFLLHYIFILPMYFKHKYRVFPPHSGYNLKVNRLLISTAIPTLSRDWGRGYK